MLDTGIYRQHPDLTHCIAEESQSCLSLTRDLRDYHGHGTHVAGIIAGSGVASDGLYRGIAPGAELIVLKVSADQSGYALDVAAGVQKAVDLGVDIINYSGGTSGWKIGQPPWKWPTKLNRRDQAFFTAAEQGILCVAAAGNEGRRKVPRSGRAIWRTFSALVRLFSLT